MRISRSLAALAIIGAVVAGVSSLFLASITDTPAVAQTRGPGYGYGSKSPTPSITRSRAKSASATPSPSGTLPETGERTGPLLKTGIIAVLAGFGLITAVWIWQARTREHRSRAPQRHPLRHR